MTHPLHKMSLGRQVTVVRSPAYTYSALKFVLKVPVWEIQYNCKTYTNSPAADPEKNLIILEGFFFQPEQNMDNICF